jgi:hypothetical protein
VRNKRFESVTHSSKQSSKKTQQQVFSLVCSKLKITRKLVDSNVTIFRKKTKQSIRKKII